MRSLYFLLFTIVFGLCFASCEEEPIEMLEVVIPAGDKAVLVEDFTGVNCPNCPEGARIIENLRGIYGKDRVIPLAIHTRFFDELQPNSQYQFKTDDGQQLQDHLDVLFGKPAAAINRIIDDEDGDRFFLNSAAWPEFITKEIERPSEINMGMTLNYNEETRQLNISTTFIPLRDINTPLNITIVIAESGLIDPQTDIINNVTTVVDDYVHDHVLRDVITSPEGDAVGLAFTQGTVYEQSYSYTIPEDNSLPWWNVDNCEIVAFINIATSESRRVLQVVQSDIVN